MTRNAEVSRLRRYSSVDKAQRWPRAEPVIIDVVAFVLYLIASMQSADVLAFVLYSIM